MSLSQYSETMDGAIKWTIKAANAFRKIANGTGDLNLSDIEAAQGALGNAKRFSIDALAQGRMHEVEANAYMVQRGGPQTLDDFQVSIGTLEVQATAWNHVLDPALGALKTRLIKRSVYPYDYKMPETESVIAAVHADPLRQSPELANLIAAFTSVGA